jgi:hypothetical protein
MPWPKIGRVLAICGALIMMFGASVLPVQGAESAHREAGPLLQPSPRPTLPPQQRPNGDSSDGPGMGRITGTVIDLTTGAPTPGVRVNIGGVTTTTDSNGNYDQWLPAGPYAVALVLDPSMGTPAQGQVMVDLAAGATVVVHLSFRSPAAVVATQAPTNPTPTAAQPAAAPLASRSRGAAPRPHASPRLPRTGEQQSESAWLWIAFGTALLAAGGLLELRRMRRVPALAGASASSGTRLASGYDNARLLARLLAGNAREIQPERTHDAADGILLAALLATKAGEDHPSQQE